MVKKTFVAYEAPTFEVHSLETYEMLCQSADFASEIEEIEIIDYSW